MKESRTAEAALQSPLKRRPPPSKSISSTSTSESLLFFSVALSQDLESRFASPNFRYAQDDPPSATDSTPSPSSPTKPSQPVKGNASELRLDSEQTPECEHLDTEELVTPRTPWETRPRACASTRSPLRAKHSHHLSSLPNSLSSFSFAHRVRHASNDSSLFTLEHVLSGHRNTITGAISMGSFIISASADYTLRLWDLRNTAAKSRLSPCQSVLAHKGRVAGIARLKQDRIASIGGETCAIWSLSDHTLERISRFQIGPGTCIAAPSPLTLLLGFTDGELAVYSVETAQATMQYEGRSKGIGALMCMERGAFVTGTSDGRVDTWDFRSPKVAYSLSAHSDTVTSLLELDDNCFLSSASDSCIKVRCI